VEQGRTRNPGAPRLLNQVRDKIRLKGYSPYTEATYVRWIKRYILFSGKRHPLEMGEKDVEAFLSHLASKEHVSPSTQNQALCAIVFLYKAVLDRPLQERISAVRAKRPRHLPTVLGVGEVERLLKQMTGTPRLVAQMLYGSGLRVNECLMLRVQHLDFENRWVVVVGGKGGKGGKDRVTVLPRSLVPSLKAQLTMVKQLHEKDLRSGLGAVILPHAYHLKDSGASSDFRWQFVFPSVTSFEDVKTGRAGRWHLSATTVSRELAVAARRAGINKRVSPHVLRHCFATHLLEAGVDVRLIQALLGHRSVTTTMVYAHLVESRRSLVESPLDAIILSFSPPHGGGLTTR
jgi:integron integrase